MLSGHYLSQCWLSSLSPYGSTTPQCVNDRVFNCFRTWHFCVLLSWHHQDIVSYYNLWARTSSGGGRVRNAGLPVITGNTLLAVACEYCPEWLRLSPGLPSPAEAGLWQLTQGSRYGSHHARSLETSWWIGNKNCQILRRTHSKLCYM